MSAAETTQSSSEAISARETIRRVPIPPLSYDTRATSELAGRPSAYDQTPFLYPASTISIFLGFICSALGILTVSTPCVIVAVILLESTSVVSVNCRW